MKVYVGYCNYEWDGCGMPEAVFLTKEKVKEWAKLYNYRRYIELDVE
jgi:hypothetical protein